MNTMSPHPVVSQERWLAERQALLTREKDLMRQHDQLAADRRALPWVRVEKDYTFATPLGPRKLADLFGARRQLLVQHFMFGPGWEQGCPSCSYMADHADGMMPHLAQRDIAFVAVSRAPLAELLRFRERMGWRFDWVSSHGSDFNFDFAVSFTPEQQATGRVRYNYALRAFPAQEAPGISAFYRNDAGAVFHTYSTFGRGVEAMMGAYHLMDLAPLGRDEAGLPFTMAWVKHHDRYDPAPAPQAAAHACCAAGA